MVRRETDAPGTDKWEAWKERQGSNGGGLLLRLAPALLAALLAGFGSYVAVSNQVVRLEERIDGVRREITLRDEARVGEIRELRQALRDNSEQGKSKR